MKKLLLFITTLFISVLALYLILNFKDLTPTTISNNTDTNSKTSHNSNTFKSEKIYKIVDLKPTEDFEDLRHKQIWDFFLKFIPSRYVSQITFLEVVDKPENSIAANIINLENEPNSWKLKINLDKVYFNDNLNSELLSHAYIHELGHLLTLNSREIDLDYTYLNLSGKEFQSDFKQKEKKCHPNYYLQEGCSKDNSIINQFWQKFWLQNWTEYDYIQQDSSDESFFKRSEEFYQRYKDSFVSRIAATNPEEDIAETFSYFILNEKPIDDIKISDQKILWLWSDPAMVEIRQKIIQH